MTVIDLLLAEVPPEADFALVIWRVPGSDDVEFRRTSGVSAVAIARTLRLIADDIVAMEHGAPNALALN